MEELNVWASSQQKFFRRSKTETGEGGCTICLQNKNILCNVHMKYAKKEGADLVPIFCLFIYPSLRTGLLDLIHLFCMHKNRFSRDGMTLPRFTCIKC